MPIRSIDRLADVDQHEQFVDASASLAGAEPVEAALQIEQFAAGLLRIQRGVLQGDTDAQADHVGAVRATSNPATVAVPDDGSSSVVSMRTVVLLPGAVRAEEAVDLAGGDVEIDAVDGDGVAESTGERPRLQRRVHDPDATGCGATGAGLRSGRRGFVPAGVWLPGARAAWSDARRVVR